MTATAISRAFDWIDAKAKCTPWGTISVAFVIQDGQIVRIDREVKESEKIGLTKLGNRD